MKRDFLTVTDFSRRELEQVLQRAAALKKRPYGKALSKKVVALVFQKPSMRTRVAFEVAVMHLGGQVAYLGNDDIQLGSREPVKDVARVLSRYLDGIVLRTFGHDNVVEFAKYAAVPVINGLSDLVHPCQALADVMTIREAVGKLKGVRVAYIGDGNNVLHSLAEACALTGVQLTAATPDAHRPDAAVWRRAEELAAKNQGSLAWTNDPISAVQKAQIVYTDVWVSMGQEAEKAERLPRFAGYQVNEGLLREAAPGCKVMHCLPAHRGEEISDGAMESKQSLVFDQAENRLHVHKAILEFLMAGRRSGKR